jgi:hypothetical protein
MTRQNATGVIPIYDPLPAMLKPMRALVTSVFENTPAKSDHVWLVASLSLVSASYWLHTTLLRSDMTSESGRTGDAGTPTPVTSPATHRSLTGDTA